VRLEPVADRVTRDRLLSGELAGREAAPGWPHVDTAPGMGFLDSGGLVFLVIDHDGRIAGECGTKAPADADGRVEIGYGLAPSSRGHGLGTAAVTALVGLLSTRPEVAVVEAEVHVGNEPSWRILERLGFVIRGDVRSGHQRYELPSPGRPLVDS
jgi:RimJ/RimL family protein N-acetyltransferase